MEDSNITYDKKRQETCQHKNQVLENYDPIWHDGDIVCADCGKHIRSYDAG